MTRAIAIIIASLLAVIAITAIVVIVASYFDLGISAAGLAKIRYAAGSLVVVLWVSFLAFGLGGAALRHAGFRPAMVSVRAGTLNQSKAYRFAQLLAALAFLNLILTAICNGGGRVTVTNGQWGLHSRGGRTAPIAEPIARAHLRADVREYADGVLFATALGLGFCLAIRLASSPVGRVADSGKWIMPLTGMRSDGRG